jgi:hypothetical protein
VRAIAQSLVDTEAGPPLSDAHAALLRALADLRGVRLAAPDPAAAQRYALAGGGASAHPPAAVLAPPPLPTLAPTHVPTVHSLC